ncbi:MAG: DUF721 domain-containing protein [Candidatus Omnitrophica bacterium]|nr:DUF721 domain-containing protein [Candidatus Omnitrophota bacterium]
MSKSKAHSTAPLVEILPQIFNGLRPDARPSQEAIQEIWERLVGKEAARHSWPRRLHKGRLLVEVENSGWMYNLRPKKMPLLEGLIELLGAGRIQALGFRMGEKKDA